MFTKENLSFITDFKDEAAKNKAVQDYRDYYDIDEKKFALFFLHVVPENHQLFLKNKYFSRISSFSCYRNVQYFYFLTKIFRNPDVFGLINEETLRNSSVQLFRKGLGIPNSSFKKIIENFDIITQKFTTQEKNYLRELFFNPEKKQHFFNSFKEVEIFRNNVVKLFIEESFVFLGFNEFIFILEENYYHYKEQFEKSSVLTKKTSYLQNIEPENKITLQSINTMKKLWELSDEDCKILDVFIYEILTETFSAIHRTLEEVSRINATDYVLKTMFNLSKSEFIRMAESKLLNRLGITEDIIPNHTRYITDSIDYSFNIVIKKIESFENKTNRAVTEEELTKFYIPSYETSSLKNSLNIEDFSYLGEDLLKIKTVLEKNLKKDILIWGNPGYGKTEVVSALAKASNINLLNLNDIVDKNEISDSQTRLKHMLKFKSVAKNLSNIVLLVDEAEDFIHDKSAKNWINSNIGQHDITTFWILNDIKDIHASYLRRFDYILEINHMPFEKRLELSKKMLGDNNQENLAYKIAQAIHTPAEIISAIEWAKSSEDFSWNNISNKINGYQKLISKSTSKENGNFEISVIQPSQEFTLENFAGYGYVKEEAQEFLDIFLNPQKYKALNAKIPKGILFAGSPGVGKTLFARCLSSSVNTNLITANSSDLASNPQRIKSVFDKAKAIAPCIVFLDEIDVLGSNVVNPDGSIDTKKQEILNQLLTEMDGFEKYSGILVIGATHRSGLLDPALRRSGRFGKTIYFREPSKADRTDIYKHYVKQVVAEDNIDYQVLARLSGGFTSADISQAVNEAALLAARKGHLKVTQEDLVEATDKVYFGTTMNGFPMTEIEKFRTAVHEAGHALISVKNGNIVQRATIKPHESFLGMVQTEKVEGDYGWSLSSIKSRLEILLAGMIAEKVILGEFKSGNSSDIAGANRLLEQAFNSYGMSKTLSVLSQEFSSSERRLIQIEDEKRAIMDEAFKNTETWLTNNRKHLLEFAKLLLEQRCLDVDEMQTWFDNNINIQKENIIVFKEGISAEEMIEQAFSQCEGTPMFQKTPNNNE